jgi:hypothetical protein
VKRTVLKAGRILFGLIFVTTSVGKLLDNRGFAEVLQNYRLFPSWLVLPLALAISLGELYLGLLLWRNRQLVRAALATVAINSGYFLLAALTLWRGIALTNCGCFGVFLARPLSHWTLVEDGILVVLSFILLSLARTESTTSLGKR